jgi:hypothetical protein
MIRAILFVAALVAIWFVMTAAVTLYHAPRFKPPIEWTECVLQPPLHECHQREK